MTKTPILSAIEPRLEALNDQLCFFQLLEHEFAERLASFGPGLAEAYTTDIFARNPYATRIHVTLKKLPAFQASHREVAFGAHFSTSYEIAADYFRRAIGLLSEVLGTALIVPPKKREGPEDHFARALSASSLPAMPVPVHRTLSYCRYRRNAFIHLSASPSAQYVTLTNDHGAAMNVRWAAERRTVDFSVPSVDPLAETDTIVLLQLLRICTQELDAHVASLLTNAGIAAYIARRSFRGKPSPNREVLHQRAKKLRRKSLYEFGVDVGETAAIDAAR